MARGVLNVKQASRDGIDMGTATVGDATNGHTVPNDGKTGIIVKNTGATARIVTFKLFKTVDGLSITPRAKSLAAGATLLFGPFPTDHYGANLEIDVAHAELTLQAVRV